VARARHSHHRSQHGRLDHRRGGSRRLGPGSGRHHGRHGRIGYSDVRSRPRSRPALLSGWRAMRIATWNVNSLKARLEKVEWWLERAAPDVLLIQETKLTDAEAPVMAFTMAGYDLIH